MPSLMMGIMGKNGGWLNWQRPSHGKFGIRLVGAGASKSFRPGQAGGAVPDSKPTEIPPVLRSTSSSSHRQWDGMGWDGKEISERPATPTPPSPVAAARTRR